MSSALNGAVLLLGPPGVGKSLLGGALARLHRCDVHSYLDVGEELRASGLLQQQQIYPTEEGRKLLAAEARRMVAERCRQLQAGGSGRCAGSLCIQQR